MFRLLLLTVVSRSVFSLYLKKAFLSTSRFILLVTKSLTELFNLLIGILCYALHHKAMISLTSPRFWRSYLYSISIAIFLAFFLLFQKYVFLISFCMTSLFASHTVICDKKSVAQGINLNANHLQHTPTYSTTSSVSWNMAFNHFHCAPIRIAFNIGYYGLLGSLNHPATVSACHIFRNILQTICCGIFCAIFLLLLFFFLFKRKPFSKFICCCRCCFYKLPNK